MWITEEAVNEQETAVTNTWNWFEIFKKKNFRLKKYVNSSHWMKCGSGPQKTREDENQVSHKLSLTNVCVRLWIFPKTIRTNQSAHVVIVQLFTEGFTERTPFLKTDTSVKQDNQFWVGWISFRFNQVCFKSFSETRTRNSGFWSRAEVR